MIIFQNEKARNFLLDNNFIFTARFKKRREDTLYVAMRRQALVEKRGGKKIADVLVIPFGIKALWQLREYVTKSGFLSWEEWKEALIYLNPKLPWGKGIENIIGLWLYLVVIIQSSENTEIGMEEI